jgi:hypothetical protein
MSQVRLLPVIMEIKLRVLSKDYNPNEILFRNLLRDDLVLEAELKADSKTIIFTKYRCTT